MHDGATRHGITLEFLQVNIEVGERTVADRGGGGTDFLVIAEFSDAVGAPARSCPAAASTRTGGWRWKA
jgi:hypothetical protein